jgi:hypothetical protein
MSVVVVCGLVMGCSRYALFASPGLATGRDPQGS